MTRLLCATSGKGIIRTYVTVKIHEINNKRNRNEDNRFATFGANEIFGSKREESGVSALVGLQLKILLKTWGIEANMIVFDCFCYNLTPCNVQHLCFV